MAAIHQTAPWLTQYVVEIEIERDPTRHNILLDQPYTQLLQAAQEGRLLAIIGGPNCRTWSIRLHYPQRDGTPGQPLRGRTNDAIWGLRTNTTAQQSKTDDDSMLILRMLHLMDVATHSKSSPLFFLEHPADPAQHSPHHNSANCSSIWDTHFMQQFTQQHSLHVTTFSQCNLGNPVDKATTIAHNIHAFRKYDGWMCEHDQHKYTGTTSELSRWGWDMNIAIATGLQTHLQWLKDYHPDTQLHTDRPHDLATHPTTSQPELMVSIGHKQRPLRDGGGKPSPGRLPPNARKRPPLATLGATLLAMAGQPQHTATALAIKQSQLTSTPESLSGLHLRHIQQHIQQYTHCNNIEVTAGQPFTLHLITALAMMAHDPDHAYPTTLHDGVPLGVNEPLPRSPDIWPTKDELTNCEHENDEPPPPRDHPNYPSATEHAQAIEQTYIEERALGMTQGPYTIEQAATICQCQPHEICCGALSGKPEGRYNEKLRTIHDGTVNHVNEWIRNNQVEKTTAPGLHDVLYAIHYINTHDYQLHTMLKLDITKAHRRIKIQQKDWKYMTARIHDHIWINTVGTYGIASAQYYWGRMAALLLRLIYATFPQVTWAFVYVDDFILLIPDNQPELTALAIMMFLHALGVPLSWKKTALGTTNVWLGFQVNATNTKAQLTPTKHQEVTAILTTLRRTHNPLNYTRKQIEKIAGKLQWSTHVCPTTRPFLQPIYAWLNATKTAGRASKQIKQLATTILHIINTPPTSLQPMLGPITIHGATDAGANQTTATIGGWYTNATHPQQHNVHWFSTHITQADHPWAYEHDNPQRRISAIELYATLLLVKTIAKQSDTNHTGISTTLRTDNLGNTYNIMNYKANTWPNSALMMEIALTQHYHHCKPTIQHIHRDLNTWADQLTHSNYEGFNPTLRFTPDQHNWHILPQLLHKCGQETAPTDAPTTPTTTGPSDGLPQALTSTGP